MVNNQKAENLLNLALEATPEERAKSLNLNTGFDAGADTWELIVRYHGNLAEISERNPDAIISIQELGAGYAAITILENQISWLTAQPEIEFVEKPKRLFFSTNQGRMASCIPAVQTPQINLLGGGVLVAVIDSGVDYFHTDFRNLDGTTRIRAILDQSMEGGREYSEAEINRALEQGNREAAYQLVPVRDLSGHGTEVLGIAAGTGRASGGLYRGVAPESQILVVKLGRTGEEYPATVELMKALAYVMKKAEEWNLPVAVNLSFGNVYGAHDGESLLETYIDALAQSGRNVISIGTGNEGNAAGHVEGSVRSGEKKQIEFGIAANETVMNLQLWKNYADEFKITLIAPNGTRLGPFEAAPGAQRFSAGMTQILVYYGEPKPYSADQEIYLDFIPKELYVDSGVWKIELDPKRIVDGTYRLWLPTFSILNSGTRFYEPTATTTLTIPSTARRALSVAAYDSRRQTYASFSGRGNESLLQKPDLAAPGVGIMTTDVGGGYVAVTGTSFATPFVTGSAALMMEWGIVRGNDPFLYGEKVKAYLRRGARQLPGFADWPNEVLGWGALCVKDSLPV